MAKDPATYQGQPAPGWSYERGRLEVAYVSVATTHHDGATAPADGAVLDCEGMSTLGVQVETTGTVTAVFEGTIDGANWHAVSGVPFEGGAQVTQVSAAGLWQVDLKGLASFRVRLAAVTGEATVVSRGVA